MTPTSPQFARLAEDALSAEQPDLALSFATEAYAQLDAAPQRDHEHVVHVLLLLAEACRELGRGDAALAHAERAFAYAGRHRVSPGRHATADEMIACICERRGDNAAALRWFAKGIALLEELGSESSMHRAFLFADCAALHQRLGDGPAAVSACEDAIRLVEAIVRRARGRRQRALATAILLDLRDALVSCHRGDELAEELPTFLRLSDVVQGTRPPPASSAS